MKSCRLAWTTAILSLILALASHANSGVTTVAVYVPKNALLSDSSLTSKSQLSRQIFDRHMALDPSTGSFVASPMFVTDERGVDFPDLNAFAQNPVDQWFDTQWLTKHKVWVAQADSNSSDLGFLSLDEEGDSDSAPAVATSPDGSSVRVVGTASSDHLALTDSAYPEIETRSSRGVIANIDMARPIGGNSEAGSNINKAWAFADHSAASDYRPELQFVNSGSARGGVLDPGFENAKLDSGPWKRMGTTIDTGQEIRILTTEDGSVEIPAYSGKKMLRLGRTNSSSGVSSAGVSQTFTPDGNPVEFAFKLTTYERTMPDWLIIDLVDVTTGLPVQVGDDGNPLAFLTPDGVSRTCSYTPCRFPIQAMLESAWPYISPWTIVKFPNLPTRRGDYMVTFAVEDYGNAESAGGNTEIYIDFASSGGVPGASGITVQNKGNGRYAVTVPDASVSNGVIHLTTVGDVEQMCSVVNESDSGSNLVLDVRCASDLAAVTQSRFNVFFHSKNHLANRDAAFLAADQPQSSLYTPSRSWNSKGGVNTVFRQSAGIYEVFLEKVDINAGTVMVSTVLPDGSRFSQCGVRQWTFLADHTRVLVECRDPAGQYQDARFNLSVMSDVNDSVESDAPHYQGAFVYADRLFINADPSLSYRPDAARHFNNASDDRATIHRKQAGIYIVSLPGLDAAHGIPFITPEVSADGRYCSVPNWSNGKSGVDVHVQCARANGGFVSAVDSRFTLQFFSDRPVGDASDEAVSRDSAVETDEKSCIVAENRPANDFGSNGVGSACDTVEYDSNTGRVEIELKTGGFSLIDSDNDGVFDVYDNCPTVANPDQRDTIAGGKDTGEPGLADACEDYDGDTHLDAVDNCPTISNLDQSDFDNDGRGDACSDFDIDGILDSEDQCPEDKSNDADGDGICGNVDNCPLKSNPKQADHDFNGIGDACDKKSVSLAPICRGTTSDCVSPETEDEDGDGLGAEAELILSTDPSDPDTDDDGIWDGSDNCPVSVGQSDDQTDTDRDGSGDVCDLDDDDDGIDDHTDNCPLTKNSDQANMDGDEFGDACDIDIDGDGLNNDVEMWYGTSSTEVDTDGDGLSDADEVFADPPTDPTVPNTPDTYFLVFEAVDETNARFDLAQWAPTSRGMLRVKVSVRAPDGLPTKMTGAMRAVLQEVSRWPGVATNDDSEVCPCKADMSLARDSEKFELTKTVASVDFTIFKIHSLDYAASARLKVDVALDDGTQASGTLRLPQDSDYDSLPDAFENQYAALDPYLAHSMGSEQLDGSADIDSSLDNNYQGDGLTNWQEYRGMLFDKSTDCNDAGKIHVRLSPENKDLFVRGDHFRNSCAPNEPGDVTNVQAFSVKWERGSVVQSAFEETGIHVHDLTGMLSFAAAQPSRPGYSGTEPPHMDIAVVTNNLTTTQGRVDIFADGLINQRGSRYWTWDVKGDSYFGDGAYYAYWINPKKPDDVRQGTTTYHLNLMNYVYNRPYLDETDAMCKEDGRDINCPLNSPANGLPNFIGLLDPADNVEDMSYENGLGPEVFTRNGQTISEDTIIVNGQLDGDRIGLDWDLKAWLPGPEDYYRGYNLSVFDIDGDGYVENPPITDPLTISQMEFGKNLDHNEYDLAELQTFTIIHELGHAVGIVDHSSDPTDVMYIGAENGWNRAGHFSAASRQQIRIHNKTE